MVGSLALGNVQFNRYRGVSLSLVSREMRRDPRGRARGQVLDLGRYRFDIPIDGIADGEAIPFRLRIPDHVPVSYESKLWSLRWVLEARAHIAWASDVFMRIPVTVVSRGSRTASKAQRFAPPTVGSERVRRIWSAVAGELGMRFDGQALSARLPEATVKVHRDHRGDHGIFLVAELRYPRLHLCLDGGLATGFRRLVGGGVALGDAEWDRRHYVTGRDPGQIRALGTALLSQLAGHQVADWDDEHLVIERRDAGQAPGPLRQLTAAALALARELGQARAAIPPPQAMASAVPSWLRLAQRLGGPLETARMAVHGRFDGIKAEVATEWNPDGTPVRTIVQLKPDFPIEDKCCLHWSDGQYSSGDPQQLPGQARALLAKAQEDALALRIEQQQLELSVPAPELDANQLVERLHQLEQLTTALRSKVGPYR
jgi:hypothetical protein